MANIAELQNIIGFLDGCFSECLARAGGAIDANDPKDRNFYLQKAIALKPQIDKIHYAMFHTNSAGFSQLSSNLDNLNQLQKQAKARIHSAVSTLQATLDIVAFVDDCLIIAAGISKSL